MSYHNVKVTYRMTGKEHLMFGRLQVLHRCKTASDLIRLAMGVLYQFGFEDMPPQDRDSNFAGYKAADLVVKLKAKCRTIPPAELSDTGARSSDTRQVREKKPAAATARKKRSPVTT